MKRNNDGFSFVIVIFVIVLVSIVVGSSIILTRVNADMKKNYSKDSVNYYTAESGLNAIRACIQEICADKLRESYKTISLAMSDIPSDKLDEEFRNCYITSLYNYFKDAPDKASIITNYMRGTEVNNGSSNIICYLTLNETNKVEDKGFSATYSDIIASVSRGTFTIKEVNVNYNSGKHVSSIVTDIVCKAPNVFGDLSYKSGNTSSFLDYAVIANRNIDIESEITCNGDLYAGNDLIIGYWSKSCLNLYSNRLVTKNNVVVYPSSSFYYENSISNNKSDLFTKNLISLGVGERYENGYYGELSPIDNNSGNIDLDCELYVKEDTSLNSANKGIKLSGQYYGYGDNKSSFNINASNITADLTGLDCFWLSGNNYIEVPNDIDGSNSILTGESLSAKFLQSAYLVPSCCLYYKDSEGNRIPITNPVSREDFEVDLSLNKENGGIDLTRYDVGYKVILANFKNSNSTIKRRYVYLDFKDSSDASKYLYDLSLISKDYLSNRADSYNLGNISFSDSCTLKTAGNIINYDKIRNIVNVDFISADIDNTYTKFKNSAIKKKYENLVSTLTETTRGTEASLFDELINRDLIESGTCFKVDDYYFSSDDVVYYNGKKNVSDLITDIKDSSNLDYRVIISKGDVTIKGNFRGLVIATGNVIVNGYVDGTIISGNDVEFSLAHTGIDNNRDYITPLNFLLNIYENKNDIREYFKVVDSISPVEEDSISSIDVSKTISYNNYVRGNANE